MKDVVKFLKYSSIILVLSTGMIILTFLGIVVYPRDVFSTSYQSVIQTKYDNLMNTEEPKIIIIGGSSAAFGIREEIIREETGYEVVNLGVHAGMGGLFNTEVAKANIDKGDVVLLGYEYGWGKPSYFQKLGIDLVMSSIDSRIDMYQVIPWRNYNEVFGYLFTYAGKKQHFAEPAGTYTRKSFDEKGEMILPRAGYVIEDYQSKIDIYGKITEADLMISEESREYLKEFKEYAEDRGASVYFISPPLLEDAYQDDKRCLAEFAENAQKQTEIPYITDPEDYIFPSRLMFDTIYHCNSEGELYRTELLIEDLKKVLLQ